MELFLNKSLEDLNAIAIKRLSQSPIKEVGRGGIAKLLLSIINEFIAGFYETLSLTHAQAFLSTATGVSLDAIGYLLYCERLEDEVDNDDKYRDRISKQILSVAAANEASIRLAALSVKGVKDVKTKKYTYGTGSFSMFIISDTLEATQELISEVKAKVNETVGYGIKFDVSNPELVQVEAKIKLLFRNTINDSERSTITSKVKDAIKKYFNSRAIGEQIVINEITQRVMETSEDILNYQLYELRVDNKKVMNVDQKCRWNERFIESSKPEAIIVS